MLHDPLASSLAMLVVGGLSVAMFLTFGRRHGVVLIATLAFAVRVLRGIQVQVTGDVSDGISYDAFGVALSRFWSDTGPDPGTWLGKDGFPALLGVIYTNVGHAPEVGYLLNAFAGGLAVLVVAATTAQMGWLTAVRPAAWIVALWPIGIVWGGMLLRESIVTLLLAVGLWGAVRLYKLHVASGTVAILGAGVAMIFMRGGLAFLLLVGMPLVAVVVTNVRGRASPGRWLLAIGAGAVAVLAISVLSGYFEGGRYFEYRAEVSQEQNSGTSSFSESGMSRSTTSCS